MERRTRERERERMNQEMNERRAAVLLFSFGLQIGRRGGAGAAAAAENAISSKEGQ